MKSRIEEEAGIWKILRNYKQRSGLSGSGRKVLLTGEMTIAGELVWPSSWSSHKWTSRYRYPIIPRPSPPVHLSLEKHARYLIRDPPLTRISSWILVISDSLPYSLDRSMTGTRRKIATSLRDRTSPRCYARSLESLSDLP